MTPQASSNGTPVNASLQIRPSSECRYDVVALGEVMLRFDPGEGRVRTARSFRVSEGGGEYNVGRALCRVFGHRAALVTAIGDNEIGRLLEDLLLQGGMNLDHVVWRAADDVGRQHRTPLNFTERGFGVRPPRGVYDRANSATASLQPDDVDWEHLFGQLGVRWLHTGGIFAGLTDSTFDTARAAITAARRNGTIVSYDVNYRPSLWTASGGPDAHRRVTRELVGDVDVLLGVDAVTFEDTVDQVAEESAAVSVIATTRRVARSASVHDWGGSAWSRAGGFVEGTTYERLDVLDRVGGGDGFAAGLIHGLLTGAALIDALDIGIAHGALVMTTPGDTSSVAEADVMRLVAGNDADVIR
jgi:2-dehydro-3-deoxygluconokinase